MTKGKVYMFGDSHTAGHELGPKRIDYKAFMKARGYNSVQEAWEQLSNEDYMNKIGREWFEKINNLCTPLESWAGKIAQKLDMSFINFAYPGASFDYQLNLLIEQEKIDWNKDLVLFGAPMSDRYMIKPGLSLQSMQIRHMLANVRKHQMKLLSQVLPSDETMLLLYYGLVSYIKIKYPKVILCEMRAPTENVDNKIFRIEDQFYVDKSLDSFAEKFADRFYPGKHYREHIHEKYADYVIEKLTNDENYSNIKT